MCSDVRGLGPGREDYHTEGVVHIAGIIAVVDENRSHGIHLHLQLQTEVEMEPASPGSVHLTASAAQQHTQDCKHQVAGRVWASFPTSEPLPRRCLPVPATSAAVRDRLPAAQLRPWEGHVLPAAAAQYTPRPVVTRPLCIVCSHNGPRAVHH